jgi:hypothetical protein
VRVRWDAWSHLPSRRSELVSNCNEGLSLHLVLVEVQLSGLYRDGGLDGVESFPVKNQAMISLFHLRQVHRRETEVPAVELETKGGVDVAVEGES